MQRRDLDVVVVGSLHLDIVVKAARLPAIDETVQGTEWHMVSGGKGGNQARWASRFGARTALISRVGDDDFGRRLLSSLRQAGVKDSAVGVDPQTGSGMSVAILQPDSEYGAVIVSGSNLHIDPVEAVASLRALGPPVVLLLQNEIAESVNLAVASWARQAGAIVVHNAAPARALNPSLAAAVDVLVVNRVEASALAGRTIASPEEASRAASALLESYPAVVATLGNVGLVVAQRGSKPAFLPAPRVKAVSAHGAGDCFIGRIAVALATGSALVEACELANHSAAQHVAGIPPDATS